MKMMRNKAIRIASLLCLVALTPYAQEKAEDKDAEKALKTSKALTWEANETLKANDFTNAEATYRKAIAKSPANAAAPFNLGNAYYDRESYSEAFGRYKQAGETAKEKPQKHKAYHNMGNVFMKNKEYPKAVEAYKEALRNNPNDDQTRYNLALAKKMAEQPQNNNQKNNDQDNNKNNPKKDEDQKNKKDNPKDNKDNKDQKDQKDQKDKEDNPKPNNDDQNNNKDQDEEEKQEKTPDKDDPSDTQKQQPKPNQLSKQQIENLLEAMQNEEKKVQQKIDAKKIKGQRIRNEKDW